MSFRLVTQTLSTSEKPNKAIIGIHGWTGDEYVFEPVAKLLKIKDAQWHFPRAPYKADSQKGNSWFGGNDKDGWEFDKTFDGMNNLLSEIQTSGYKNSNIFLIGFSQGACLAIDFALRLPFPIGGIIPIAGFIKFKTQLLNDATIESINTPILLMHGNKDEIIPIKAGRTANEILLDRGHPIYFETYDSHHKIPINKMGVISDFIHNPLDTIKLRNKDLTN